MSIMQERLDAAIAAVLAAGWVADGETQTETVRMASSTAAPIGNGGKSGGRLTTFGGRARFHLPGTTHYVTVGGGTTCFYEKIPTEPYAYGSPLKGGMRTTETRNVLTVETRSLSEIRAKLDIIAFEVRLTKEQQS